MSPNGLTVWSMDEVRARCDEVGDCLIWRGATNSAGYPSASVNGKTVMMRRHVYTVLMAKPLTHGRRVTTRCLNPLCCSDKCLIQLHQSAILANAAERRLLQDPITLRRLQRGAVESGIAKLSAEIAADVRASTASSKDEAEARGVHIETIRAIRRGATWKIPKTAATSVFDWRPA